jgi:hypothetical protein
MSPFGSKPSLLAISGANRSASAGVGVLVPAMPIRYPLRKPGSFTVYCFGPTSEKKKPPEGGSPHQNKISG